MRIPTSPYHLGLGLAGLMASSAATKIKRFLSNVSCISNGSVVYCDLLAVEHSGIYVGDGEIVHLTGEGWIERVDFESFLNRLDGANPAFFVYAACNGEKAVGSANACRRALEAIGESREYSLLKNNCHRFVAECLTGCSEPDVTTFSSLESLVERDFNVNNWRCLTIETARQVDGDPKKVCPYCNSEEGFDDEFGFLELTGKLLKNFTKPRVVVDIARCFNSDYKAAKIFKCKACGRSVEQCPSCDCYFESTPTGKCPHCGQKIC